MSLCVLPAAEFAVEPQAGPPEGASDALRTLLEPEGLRVKDPAGGTYVEFWVRKTIPTRSGAEETRSVQLGGIAPDAVLGVIRYARPGSDFCGRPIPPGVYTVRYSIMPEDGNHMGVAPGRDFALLIPAALDPDPAASLSYEELMERSRQASGSSHPAILFLVAPEPDAGFPGIVRTRENYDVLQVKSGDVSLGIVVIGRSEG
jgi:hypothetical protein